MIETDIEFLERLLVWAIHGDRCIQRRDRQAGRESYDSIWRRERFFDAWLGAVQERYTAQVKQERQRCNPS